MFDIYISYCFTANTKNQAKYSNTPESSIKPAPLKSSTLRITSVTDTHPIFNMTQCKDFEDWIPDTDPILTLLAITLNVCWTSPSWYKHHHVTQKCHRGDGTMYQILDLTGYPAVISAKIFNPNFMLDLPLDQIQPCYVASSGKYLK